MTTLQNAARMAAEEIAQTVEQSLSSMFGAMIDEQFEAALSVEVAKCILRHLAPIEAELPRWEPIENAPRIAGKRFLIAEDCGEGSTKSVSVGYQLDTDEWYFSDGDMKAVSHYGYRVTHFMPIPKGPEA